MNGQMTHDTPPPLRKLIGRQEYCDIPQLNLFRIRAKVDSGAKTSALHAYNIASYVDAEGMRHISFNTHPENRRNKRGPRITLPVLDRRQVISSNGQGEERYLVLVDMVLGDQVIPTEITLTSRHKMSFPILVGRNTLMKGKFVIDVSKGYLLGDPVPADL